ncbi:Aste57867_18645 [Aphanomyces stellatus]|uniref:Aste57867_18645 protein n=1 Tax=Aphanomyces stellatus TaxID=120398 RepID=A0A485LAN9_9STRA|nr:hypothetical protein As57867_018583 [Aphanomyces stellatus]VFT95380.1 Aste57867_18645 [Aphanomyces stellatus]
MVFMLVAVFSYVDSTSEFYRLLLQQHETQPTTRSKAGAASPHKLKHKSPRHLRPLSPPQRPSMSVTVDGREIEPEPASMTRLHHLPQLEARVLRRQRVFLNANGVAELGFEEIVQYNEVDSAVSSNPLALWLPKKCSTQDEVPLMPCFAQAHRAWRFEAEMWREPIRDRDKRWSQDELSLIQAVKARRYPMTDGKLHTGKWRAHMHSTHDNEQRLKRYGVLIDQSYVVVTAVGVNIFGRIYGPGLQSKRYIILNVYDPSLALNHTMQLTMDDLEDLFVMHNDLLVAGRKDDLVAGIVAMLYFEYPDDVQVAAGAKPILHINREMKVSASKLRRIQRERQHQLEEEQKRLEALRFMTMARRGRHRIVARSIKIHGLRFTVTVHQYPHQIRNFSIVAYHPTTGMQYKLPVGLHHAGRLAGIIAPPHQWSRQEKVQIADTVIRHLRLVHNAQGESALSVDGRVGFFAPSVGLDCAETLDALAEKAYRQGVANEITLVQDACYRDVQAIEETIAVIEAKFGGELMALERIRDDLKTKEQALKDELDDVESRGLKVDDGADKAIKTQLRQELRETRQRIKDERKEAVGQIKATQHEITTLLAKRQTACAAANADIKIRMLDADAQVAAINDVARQPFEFHNRKSGERRWANGWTDGRRHKLEMGTTNLVVSGAARVEGERVRYTMWDLGVDKPAKSLKTKTDDLTADAIQASETAELERQEESQPMDTRDNASNDNKLSDDGKDEAEAATPPTAELDAAAAEDSISNDEFDVVVATETRPPLDATQAAPAALDSTRSAETPKQDSARSSDSEDTDDDDGPPNPAMQMLRFDFYSPTTGRTVSFTCSKLAFCIWSKTDRRSGVDRWPLQKEIPHFVYYPNGAEPSLLELELKTVEMELHEKRLQLFTLTPGSWEAQKCVDEMQALVDDKARVTRATNALYHPLVVALAERIHPVADDDAACVIDTLLLEMPAVDIVTSKGDSVTHTCQIHVDGRHVWFDVDGGTYRRVHPYTDELMNEFATESAVEMKVHMELILSTMQITFPESGQTDATLEFID